MNCFDKDGEVVYVCKGCLEEVAERCEDCGDIVHEENMNTVIKDGEECRVCNDCLEQDYVRCDKCCDIVHKDNVENGVCEQCREDKGDEVA